MYHADHPPAHFHAEYQGHEAFVAIETGTILQGQLPAKAARIIQEWANEHRAELLENWTKARNLEPLQRIPGADNDQDRQGRTPRPVPYSPHFF